MCTVDLAAELQAEHEAELKAAHEVQLAKIGRSQIHVQNQLGASRASSHYYARRLQVAMVLQAWGTWAALLDMNEKVTARAITHCRRQGARWALRHWCTQVRISWRCELEWMRAQLVAREIY